MPVVLRRLIFLLFIVSGFCGLLYQVIWIRLAYASFGVITPVMSVVISIFMLGLLLGSAAGGPLVKKLVRRFGKSSIFFYGLAEIGIGLGAFCVPKIFLLEQWRLLSFGGMDSTGYLFISAIAIAAALLPWCVLMGFTYPFMMNFVKESDHAETASFSFLYLANVIGAMAGALLTAGILIELFGFMNTLAIAAVCNFIIAAVAVAIAGKYPVASKAAAYVEEPHESEAGAKGPKGFFIPFLLFASGFAALCMEIIWTRNFTVILRTAVYSYAALLSTYLLATWIGSYLYRKHLSKARTIPIETLLGAAALFSLLPLVMNDPRLPFKGTLMVLLSITPFCGALGYLTPQLIDRYSKGSPTAAGWAYAVNTFGCILGPLFASYLFLAFWGVKASLLVLSLLMLACFTMYCHTSKTFKGWPMSFAGLFIALFSAGCFFNDTYEEFFHLHYKNEMRRDYAATITSMGTTRSDKILRVNGICMTIMTPITQFMAHLPLAYCEQPPTSALVICFGMGTTFRSLVSWDVNTTAVELIPSVPKEFGYFWPDADSVMSNPKAEVVIDDGRRFLMRTDKKFDVITIDPPPPLVAAGSSLLYSTEMYALVKRRLKEGGIFQIWLPWTQKEDEQTRSAMARSLSLSFPYVKVSGSIENWGNHFFASMKPIPRLSAAEIIARMPPKARRDLLTWCPAGMTLEKYMLAMLSKEIPLSSVLSSNQTAMITDARPFNEYFLVRGLTGRSKNPILMRVINKFKIQ